MDIYFRDAEKNDLETLVDIHIEAFDGFFLTSLGKGFLHSLYEQFLVQKLGILRVAYNENQTIVGFSAGSINPAAFFSIIKKKEWFKFLTAALPALIKQPITVIKKIFHSVYYSGDSGDAITDGVLLSSLAVLPNLEGNSIGSYLLNDFECYVSSLEKNRVIYLTTDAENNEFVRRFYEKNNYIFHSEFYQINNRRMLRFIKKT
ncbi:GNAT family N-acetyltransferase [Vibrio cyclitrophicus]